MESNSSNCLNCTRLDCDKLFEKLNSCYSIKEKIEISVVRYNFNYFLETNLEDLGNMPEIILPLQYVTRDLYNKHITKDQKAKTKKLSWVLKHKNEEFCTEFKEKYENNLFKSVREAESCAANIYAKYCGFYQSSKATVQSINGIRTWLKKRSLEEEPKEENSNDSNLLDESNSNDEMLCCNNVTKNLEHVKRQCVEEISTSLEKYQNSVNAAAAELKCNLEKSNVFVKLNVENVEKNQSQVENPVNLALVSVVQIIIDKDAFTGN